MRRKYKTWKSGNATTENEGRCLLHSDFNNAAAAFYRLLNWLLKFTVVMSFLRVKSFCINFRIIE